jgi:hypothetical protein
MKVMKIPRRPLIPDDRKLRGVIGSRVIVLLKKEYYMILGFVFFCGLSIGFGMIALVLS